MGEIEYYSEARTNLEIYIVTIDMKWIMAIKSGKRFSS